MKKCVYLLPLLLLLSSAARAEDEAAAVILDGDEQKYSYALGYEFGAGLLRQGVAIELDKYFLGVSDSMGKIAPKIDHEEGRALLVALQQKIRDKQMAQMKEEAAANESVAADFLKANAAKEGVMTTESGLQYEVMTEGDGPKPTAESTVTVHYTGRLADGTVFDSSVERGEPATFPLGQVIPAWTEGLQLMSLGAKYTLTVPPALGYGERGAPPRIPGNSVLVFEVELLSIE